MSDRQEVNDRLIIEGRPYSIKLIHNPLIDDVLITEARIFAAELEQGPLSDEPRRVSRDLRDFFIRLGVER